MNEQVVIPSGGPPEGMGSWGGVIMNERICTPPLEGLRRGDAHTNKNTQHTTHTLSQVHNRIPQALSPTSHHKNTAPQAHPPTTAPFGLIHDPEAALAEPRTQRHILPADRCRRRSGGYACGHHARIRLRDGRGCWWRVSTKSASPHRSPVCTDVDGEEAAGSHAWAAWSACSRRARFATPSSGVLAFGGKSSGRSDINAGPAGGLGGFLGARRGVAGDVPGPWQGRRHARITQRRRVGELEPESYFLGVGGQFQDLVKRRETRLRASRARSGGAPGRAQPVAFARRARRRLAGLARRAGRGRAKCT